MSIRIDRPASQGTPGESRTDGVVSELVTLVSTESGTESSWAWRFISVAPGSVSVPVITNSTAATATFTSPSGPCTLLIELVVDSGLETEATYRRLYSVRTANNLRYVAFGERSDPLNSLQSNDPTRSTLNEGGAWQGWEPDLSQWLAQIEQNAAAVASALTNNANIGAGVGIAVSPQSGIGRFKSLVAGSNISLSTDADEIVINAGGGSSGESNTASNIGLGTGVFAQKNGFDLEFKSLVAGSNITLTPGADAITIDAAAGSGEANTASNLGAGEGLFSAKSGVDLRFKSLVAGSNITLTPAADTVTIAAAGGASGESNTASNIGTGAAVFDSKSGVDLRFHGILGINGIGTSVVGEDVTIFPDGLTVGDLSDTTVDAAAQGSVLYLDSLGNWNTLQPGTAGQFLRTGGINNDPTWALALTGVNNLGAGQGLGSINGSVVNLKSLVAGTNVSLTSDANTVTINATASGGVSNLQEAYNVGESIATTSNNPVEITALTTTEYAMNIATGRLGMPSSMAIGTLNSVGTNCISIGANSSAAGSRGVALGVDAVASGDNSVAVGESSVITANGDFAVSVGSDNQISSLGTIAIGYNLQPPGANQLALGYNPKVSSSVGTIRVGIGKGIVANTPDPEVLIHASDSSGFNTSGSNLQLRGGLGSGSGADGYIELLSTLRVNGGVGASRDFLISQGSGNVPTWASPNFAGIYFFNDSTLVDITALGTWTQINAFTSALPFSLSNSDHGQNRVTIAEGGVFRISYSLSFAGAASNVYEVGLMVNGAIFNAGRTRVEFGSTVQDACVSSSTYNALANGQHITLAIRNITSGSDATVYEGALTVERVN